MGIDTVKLDGQGFEVLVENGQKVKKGDPLLKMDLEFIKKNAPSISSPILCTDLDDNMKVRLLKTGNVQKGEDIIAVDILA
jgi:PTS system D-glucosamine-specific IIC component